MVEDLKKVTIQNKEQIGVEHHSINCQNCLYIVGIGPGSPNYLSARAIDVLKSVDIVVGYTLYIMV